METGSATRAGKARQKSDRRRMGWMCVYWRARGAARTLMGCEVGILFRWPSGSGGVEGVIVVVAVMMAGMGSENISAATILAV